MCVCVCVVYGKLFVVCWELGVAGGGGGGGEKNKILKKVNS